MWRYSYLYCLVVFLFDTQLNENEVDGGRNVSMNLKSSKKKKPQLDHFYLYSDTYFESIINNS